MTPTFTRTPTITPTRTSTPKEAGPVITFLGVAGANGCAACNHPGCICSFTPTPTPFFDPQGRQIFDVGPRGFLFVVEAKPGLNGNTVGNFVPSTIPGQPSRPSLRALPNRNLGNGSAAVCDDQPTNQGGGGIPGFNPPDFNSSQAVTDALVDFACRFSIHSPQSPCTLNRFGNESVLTPGGLPSGSRQFCYAVEENAVIPLGDTIVAVEVADTPGNVGPRREIIFRRSQ